MNLIYLLRNNFHKFKNLRVMCIDPKKEPNKEIEPETEVDNSLTSQAKDDAINENSVENKIESKNEEPEINLEEKEGDIPILNNANVVKDGVEEEQLSVDDIDNSDNLETVIGDVKNESFIDKLSNGEFFIEMEEIYNIYEANVIWKNRIVKLCSTFNDFLFIYLEVFKKPTYRLNKFQKVFVFEAPTKAKEQNLTLQKISNEIISLKEHKDITALLNNIVIRNGDMLDIDFNKNILDLDIKKVFKDSLSTLLLISKILNRQQLQLTSLMLETEIVDRSFLDVFLQLKLLKDPLLNSSVKSFDTDDFCDNIFSSKKRVDEAAKIIGESSKLKNSFIKNMKRGIFTAYNEIIRSKKIFIRSFSESSTDFDPAFYIALFDELLKTIKEFLMDNFEIRPLSVERGDSFDIDKHNLITEPEPDDSLQNDTIKEVVNYGFELKGRIILLSDIILVKN